MDEKICLLKFCRRCAQPFSPEWLNDIGEHSSLCPDCIAQNLLEFIAAMHTEAAEDPA